jgi:hypothetical protein
MNHCHISIMCNELTFLKQKLPFLYNNFKQLIFVDYNIIDKCNSNDGTIEYIENFSDIDNKITLIKDFDPSKVKSWNGVSIIEKQKMFAEASKYVYDNIDIIWATDLDEFFEKDLINEVENMYLNDKQLVSIDLPHKIFAYNQYNVYDKNYFYIAPRITKHKKGCIYGHCNFGTYGKTIKYTNRCLYHFAFIGFKRCAFKFNKVYKNENTMKPWLEAYIKAMSKKEKHVKLFHPAYTYLYTSPYNGDYPDYIDVDAMCESLNN